MKKVLLAPTSFLLAGSGACALIYQVAWLRDLRLVFGCTTAASAAVVAIFMGGLGLGNAILGKRADTKANPLAFYALLEAGIAATAAISPWMTDAAEHAYVHLGGQLALGGIGATVVRLLLSSLVLLLPTVLMGGTLAAAITAVTTASDDSRRTPAILYGINTLGAVAGAVLSTFILLPALGTRMTLWSACALNVVVALGAYALSRRAAEPAPGKSAPTRSPRQPGRQAAGPIRPGIVYLAAGIVGFAFMLMELVWYRMLAAILGGTTFTFGLILAVALLGIGIGGALYPWFFRRRPPDLASLSATCGLEAIAMAIPFALGDRLAVAAGILHDINRAGFFGEVLGWSAIAAAVVLPASIASGVQFPVLIGELGRGDRNVGRQVGWTYACNTLGGILGSLAGGMGMIPLLSAPGAWRLVVVILAGLSVGLALAAGLPSARRSVVLRLGLSAVAVLLLAFTGPTAVWRHSGIGAGRAAMPEKRTANAMRAWENLKRRTKIWEADGIEAVVGIVSRNDLAFLVNGKSDGAALFDSGTQMGLGITGAMLHPDPRTALVVGLGTGETAGWLAKVPTLTRVDIVELEPVITEMARRCAAVNGDVLANPKAHLVFDDAREVLLTTSNRYDLIVSEPSNPFRAGVANLFTHEFYSAAKDRLNPKGIFVQWLQAYETDDTTVFTALATLKSTFAHVEVWQSKYDDVLLVCSNDPFAYRLDTIRARLAQEPYRTAYASAWRVSSAEGFLARFVAGEKLVDQIAGRYAPLVNTDDYNRIEYGYIRTLGRPSRFSLSEFHRRAAELGADRPACDLKGIDWDGVTHERFAMYAGQNRSIPESEIRDPRYAPYVRIYASWLDGDFAGMIAQWEAQGRQPVYPTETALVAVAYAVAGNAKAVPLIEKLKAHSPQEADLIRGILAMHQGRKPESLASLASAFRGLRGDPFALSYITQLALNAASDLAAANPASASAFLDALKEPFAIRYADESRRTTASYIAANVSAPAAVPWLETFEPHIPWEQDFLALRARVYSAAGHPLAGRAQADVEQFNANAAEAPSP